MFVGVPSKYDLMRRNSVEGDAHCRAGFSLSKKYYEILHLHFQCYCGGTRHGLSYSTVY